MFPYHVVCSLIHALWVGGPEAHLAAVLQVSCWPGGVGVSGVSEALLLLFPKHEGRIQRFPVGH